MPAAGTSGSRGRFDTVRAPTSSSMLGVRRTGVTAIAGELTALRVIRYHRGQVPIVDHAGL